MPLKDPVARAAYNAQRYQSKKALTQEKSAVYYQQHKAEIKAAAKKWKAEHHERVLGLNKAEYRRNIKRKKAYSHRYAAAHKQEAAKRNAARYLRDKERILKRNAAWAIINTDKVKRYHATNRKRHAGRINANNKFRACRKLQATPPWLTAAQLKQIEAYYCEAKRLEQADGIKRHVDHIYPLQGKTVCGLHVPWNLQILLAKENLKKHNKVIVRRQT